MGHFAFLYTSSHSIYNHISSIAVKILLRFAKKLPQAFLVIKIFKLVSKEIQSFLGFLRVFPPQIIEPITVEK